MGTVFFILLIISTFNPDLINRLNRHMSKSYKDQTPEQLTRKLTLLMIISFLIGIIIFLSSSENRRKVSNPETMSSLDS